MSGTEGLGYWTMVREIREEIGQDLVYVHR